MRYIKVERPDVDATHSPRSCARRDRVLKSDLVSQGRPLDSLLSTYPQNEISDGYLTARTKKSQWVVDPKAVHSSTERSRYPVEVDNNKRFCSNNYIIQSLRLELYTVCERLLI